MQDQLRQINSLLRRQTTLALATVDDDGQPRSTPLFFIANHSLDIYWFSRRTSVHSRNCARDPRASVAVFRHTEKWQEIRGVQFNGVVAVVSSRTMRGKIAREYRTQFELGASFQKEIHQSTLYCFTPRWARYLDNSQKFGYKFELKLPNLATLPCSSSSRPRSSGTAPARRVRPRAG